MFIILPLSLVLASSLGISVIIYRKKPYLAKLISLDSGDEASSLSGKKNFSWKNYGEEFFPEIKALFSSLKLNEYKAHWLVELEKFLRRTRVVVLKFDRVSDGLIKKIRRINVNDQLESVNKEINKVIASSVEILSPEINVASAPAEKISAAFLKNEEERLIVEIAKNPKDPALYEMLGDLYSEMGNSEDAQESYKAALELNPASELAKQKLSASIEKIASA